MSLSRPIAALGAVLSIALATGAAATPLPPMPFFSFYSSVGTANLERSHIEDGIAGSSVTETFEGYANLSATPLLDTFVGDFSITDASGACGGSCVSPSDQAVIRTGNNFGRVNTTAGGSKWLDSNDNPGMRLDAKAGGLGTFQYLSFLLTDLDDVGARVFNIKVDGEIVFNLDTSVRRQNSGSLFYGIIEFAPGTSLAMIDFTIDDGDGFGIDDVRLFGERIDNPPPPPVPLPASALLLLGAIGGFGALRRRKAA